MAHSTQRLMLSGMFAHARALLVPATAISLLAPAFVIAPGFVLAQGATSPSPARETPRPQDIDPGVNTSAPSQTPSQTAPARDTPRPQDVDPAVNTSTAAPAASAPSPAAKLAAPARTTASGAAGSATSGAAPTQNTSGSASAKTAGAKPALGPDGKPVKGKALDRLELDTTQITGNRELPKVLYIVPWKRSDLGDLVGKPVNSLLDEVLTPVDRDVFKRENRYYRALAPAEGQPANATGAPAAGANGAATSSGSATPAAKDER